MFLETRFRRFLSCTTSLLPENTPTRARSRARILPKGRQVVFPWLSWRLRVSFQHGVGSIGEFTRALGTPGHLNTGQQEELILKNERTQATWCLRCYHGRRTNGYQHVPSRPNANQMMERLGPANLSSRNSCKLCDVLVKRDPMSRNQRPTRKGIYVHPLCSQHALKPAAPFCTQTQTDAELAQWYHRDPIFNEHDNSTQNKSICAVLVQCGPPPPNRPQTLDNEPRPTMALGWSWSRPGRYEEVQEAARCCRAPEKTRAGRPGHHGNPHHGADQLGSVKL